MFVRSFVCHIFSFWGITPVWDLIETWDFCEDLPLALPHHLTPPPLLARLLLPPCATPLLVRLPPPSLESILCNNKKWNFMKTFLWILPMIPGGFTHLGNLTSWTPFPFPRKHIVYQQKFIFSILELDRDLRFSWGSHAHSLFASNIQRSCSGLEI